MFEILGVSIGWKAITGGVVALIGILKGRQIRKAAKEVREFLDALDAAGEDKKYSKQEVQDIFKEGFEAAQAVAPILAKLVKRFI